MRLATLSIAIVLTTLPTLGARAATGKRCLFLHGLGVKGAGTFSKTSPQMPEALGRSNYWGNMERELGGLCSAFEYANFNTSNVGWDDAKLQSAFYEKAREVYSGGGMVFAHSAANNVLAGACVSKQLCEVRWIALAAPIRGSKVADAPKALRALGGPRGLVGASLSPKHPLLASDALSRAVRERKLVLAGACGTDGWGSGGLAGAALRKANKRTYGTGWKAVPADGVVHEDECSALSGGVKPSTSPSAPWFTCACNHADLTGSGGNHRGFYDWLRSTTKGR